MKRELAVLIAFCILLGTGIATDVVQPGPPPMGETRGIDPGLPWTDNITTDITWDTSYPYIWVKKNIWVAAGAVLTITEGATVKFNPGTGLYVNGGIIANGAPFKNVTFMPYTNTPATSDWHGIQLENSTVPSIFNHASVKFSESGIMCWGSEATITNSSIEYTYFHGILAGEGSTMLIKNNYINFTTWSGIITDNRSNAVVVNNNIRSSYYGVVCYDTAEIQNNLIRLCILGILAWGDANITFNQVRDCMDGIHGFYASPRVENNLIVSCDGNGTRFIHSNAILNNNTLVYNNVGMDIDYESKNLLDTMQNNLVNGIDIRDCFFVGKKDMVIDGLFIDSGWSKGYYGSLTAQGSVTLYDCKNITIQNSTIIHTRSAVFATNSTFKIYNTRFENSTRSQVYLEANATGASFNRSVDPTAVIIGGDNCLFQTFDNFRVTVEDYYGEPILGARVIVRENQLVLHDLTTNLSGITPILVVKDRTVSDSGVISSPLNVEVLIDGYNFEPNPITGIYVNQTREISFTDLGDIFPPTIQNVSVADGDRTFPLNGTIRIRFNEPMNRTSVENAFSITGNVTGTFSWDGFNVTFTPDSLDYGAYYTVIISTAAADEWGNNIDSPISFSFTTVQAPGTSSNTIWIVLVVIFLIGGVAGIFILKKLK
ncbi:MAG: Ig-like domain-containing protein [Candidatus Thermoplasmatota archaeon]|nr:hypothetical protein [Euryarchaeota archaeon]MBU4032636.1 Ig-like domain-containing protein [Candidatus Thermoplasmatota archaeon]MBU4072246.1 Ig-like domain-containing protein [Candidatus Thermoplasmatota archaeon]MBU4143808.1 Ig-like domain-containing protein [Candidatus Thermoplasmatota archaeon]MBU4592793.1 Ig-like domain-containing protein [Candidatus Thermoplasmatota archaeon]